MSDGQAFDEIRVSLAKAIEEWSDNELETAAGRQLAIYWGEETTRLMAHAAMAVLQAVHDCHESFIRDNPVTA